MANNILLGPLPLSPKLSPRRPESPFLRILYHRVVPSKYLRILSRTVPVLYSPPQWPRQERDDP